MTSIQTVIESILATRYFVGDSAPLSAMFHRAAPECPALIIGGANASGKSFMVSLLAAWLKSREEPEVEAIQVSMRYRAGHNVSGIQRAMMFGSEDDNSTGVNSVGGILGAIRTSNGRTGAHMVVFDEPDIGLAEEYAVPAGKLIGEFVGKRNGHCGGVAIISHSKPLIRGFLEGLGQQPHFLHMDGTQTLEKWLTSTSVRSIEELETLSARSLQRFRTISKMLSARPAN